MAFVVVADDRTIGGRVREISTGANLIKIFLVMTFLNKLEHLTQASLSCLV